MEKPAKLVTETRAQYEARIAAVECRGALPPDVIEQVKRFTGEGLAMIPPPPVKAKRAARKK